MNVTQQIDPDILSRLRDGLCAVRCRVMDARSGCDCAIAADEIERLRAALQSLVDDIHDYEVANNLYPNPGRTECWDSVARAKTLLRANEQKADEDLPTAEDVKGILRDDWKYRT